MVRLFGPISGPLHGAMVWANFRILTLVHLFEPIYGLYIGLADLCTFTMVHLFEPIYGPLLSAVVWANFSVLALDHLFKPINGLLPWCTWFG